MNKKILDKFKKTFNEEREKLTTETIDVSDVGDGAGDEMDQASAMERRNMNVIMKNRHKDKLTQLNVALARIEDGTFGTCEDCEDDIELRRLEVRPTATLCVSCQEATERRNKVYANRGAEEA